MNPTKEALELATEIAKPHEESFYLGEPEDFEMLIHDIATQLDKQTKLIKMLRAEAEAAWKRHESEERNYMGCPTDPSSNDLWIAYCNDRDAHLTTRAARLKLEDEMKGEKC